LRPLLFLATTAAFFLVPVAAASANLTVNLAGAEKGTITSTPAGINCSNVGGGAPGPTCTADFGFFVNVELKAVGSNSVLSGWTGNAGGTCSSGSANPCSYNTFFDEPLTATATFVPPPPPPSVFTDPSSAGFNDQLLTLNGRVNPGGASVSDCHFAYGLTSAYGQTVPCDQGLASLGSGAADKPVTASTEPLNPSTIYHFRLFASNIGGASAGKDRTFITPPATPDNCPNATIRAEQGVMALGLPDCMAIEMVSPPKKFNQRAQSPKVSTDGSRVLFNSPAALADASSVLTVFGDPYVATRGPSGWLTHSTNPPTALNMTDARSAAKNFTPDLTHWIHLQAATTAQGPLNIFQVLRGSLGGSTVPLSPVLSPAEGKSGEERTLEGTTADLSHVYFADNRGPNPKSTAYLPGDPRPVVGGGADPNVYVAGLDANGQPSLKLLARDRNGKAWGGNCGARLGGYGQTSGGSASERPAPNGFRSQGAISPDGSLVYFSARAAQPETGNCTEASKLRILQRKETPTGPEITQLIASECNRVSPPCSSINGDDLYQGASQDQTKVYFTTNRQLASTDLDGTAAQCWEGFETPGWPAVPGCDLYLYDATKPAGQRLTQVSAGDATDPTPGSGANVYNSIAAISRDGSRVYFTAQGILTTDPNPEGKTAIAGKPNLYTWDEETEVTSFIGTLATGASYVQNDGGFVGSGIWGASGNDTDVMTRPLEGKDSQGNDIGGDGHFLFFRSRGALTADDTDGTFRDLYRYDANTDTLARISKAAPGGVDNGSVEEAESGFSISEDGEEILFESPEAFLPGDTNGLTEPYLWRHGQLFRLPAAAHSTAIENNSVSSLSRDGSTIAFQSAVPLIPADGDTIDDIYVARADGGYPPQPLAPDCQGEVCQGPPGTVSADVGASTGSFSGRGNVKADESHIARRCPQGKRKIRRNGKTSCVKTSIHKKRASHKGERAGNKQGGQK
jgi:hypothetical protein